MKKTLTVNLGGTVFHIDEDAYQLLDKYLANLRIHFRKEEGSEEIMNDFEMRISELFNERVRLGYEVITIEHVEEVIKRMGKPEELFEGEEEKEYKEEARTQAFQEEEIPRGPKKLMRDPDNRVLGGVAGGIAAYIGRDGCTPCYDHPAFYSLCTDHHLIPYTMAGNAVGPDRSRQADDARTKRHPRKHRQNSYGWLREGQQ